MNGSRWSFGHSWLYGEGSSRHQIDAYICPKNRNHVPHPSNGQKCSRTIFSMRFANGLGRPLVSRIWVRPLQAAYRFWAKTVCPMAKRVPAALIPRTGPMAKRAPSGPHSPNWANGQAGPNGPLPPNGQTGPKGPWPRGFGDPNWGSPMGWEPAASLGPNFLKV